MKYIYLLPLIFLALFSKAQQNYFTDRDFEIMDLIVKADPPVSENMKTVFAKVINSDNVWYTFKFSSFSPNTHYDRLSFSGDSVLIGDNYYFPLHTSVDSIGDSWTPTGKYVREDNGKIWVLHNGQSNEEILIMDMNLTVGDTFAIPIDFSPSFYVSGTDLITDLAGVDRRVVELKCDKDDDYVSLRWIEGIGPDLGVFESNFEQCVLDGSSSVLTCFYTDDVQHYHTSYNLPCWKPRSANVTDASLLAGIHIYPNPGFDQITIEKGDYKNLSYQVYNTTGQLIASNNLSDEAKFNISCNEWQSGLYIIRISDATGNHFVTKWVKM